MALTFSLALLLILSHCKDEEQTPPPVVRECNLQAFVVAADGVVVQGLEASTELELLPAESIVDINGVAAGRFRVRSARTVEEEVLFESTGQDEGWVIVGSVVTSTSGTGAAEIPVYAEASATSAVTSQLAQYDAVNLLDCRGAWAYVEGTTVEGEPARGWLSPAHQCANPVSSCS